MTRFVLEGKWTGYTFSQQRIFHREVVSAKRADVLKDLHSIVYTDGTSLLISVRPAWPQEKVQEMHQYCAMIRQAERVGKPHVLVSELPA